MLFNSVAFIAFFVAVMLVYHTLERRPQNVLLLVASYCFYGSWNWRFLGLIVASTLIDFCCARVIDAEGSRETRRKAALIVSIVANLGILATFKYFNFFLDSLAALVPGLAGSLRLDVVLPVGISFYTFQTMSYTIDVYRRDLRASRDLLDFSVYVAFFPQLVAGPIERASSFLPQIQKARRPSYDHLRKGLWLILFGLFKKVVLADNLAPVANAAFDQTESLSGLEVLTGVYAFALQIYGDFSGYSAIARGTALLLGFELMQNFRMPYFAVSPSDFWKRWHISLSTWLRDYLYIPLGGNRRGAGRTYLNLCTTMLLGGLWHGAAWHFVEWGAYHGALLVGFALLGPRWSGLSFFRGSGPVARSLKAFAFFQLTCFGWVLFRAEDSKKVGHVLGSLLRFWPDPSAPGAGQLALIWVFMLVAAAPVLLIELAQEASGDAWVVKRWSPSLRLLTYCLLAWMIAVFGVTQGEEFIYFQF